MMIRLTAHQVSLHWPMLKHMALETGIVPRAGNEDALNALLAKLLSDYWQAWVIFRDEGEDRVLHAVGLTSLYEDALTGDRYLDIYALYAFRSFTPEIKADCMETLGRFVKERGCVGVLATTQNPRAEALMLDVGFVETKRVYTWRP